MVTKSITYATSLQDPVALLIKYVLATNKYKDNIKKICVICKKEMNF